MIEKIFFGGLGSKIQKFSRVIYNIYVIRKSDNLITKTKTIITAKEKNNMIVTNVFNVGRKIHLDVDSELDKNENIESMIKSFKEQWEKIMQTPSDDKIREICKLLYYKSIE